MTAPLLSLSKTFAWGKAYGPVKAIAFFPDGKKVVTVGHQDGSGRLWNLETGKELGALQEHTGVILSVAVSRWGQDIVTGGADSNVILWNLKTDDSAGHKILFSGPDHSQIHSVAFNAVKTPMLVASSGSDGTINVWKLKNDSYSNPIQKISFSKKLPNGEISMVSALQFSPTDAHVLAVTSLDKVIRIFDACTGDQIATLASPITFVFAISWFPGGERLASAHQRTVKIWDSRKGEQVGRSLIGHSQVVKTVAVSPNGKFIASGSEDRTIRIWNAVTGAQIGTPKEHDSLRTINTLQFSPDSKSILTVAENDEEVYLWNLHHLEVEEALHAARGTLDKLVNHSQEMRRDILDTMDDEFDSVRGLYEKDIAKLLENLDQKKEDDIRAFTELKDTIEAVAETQYSEFVAVNTRLDDLPPRLDELLRNHNNAFRALQESISESGKKHKADLIMLQTRQELSSQKYEAKLEDLQGEVRELKKLVENLPAQIKKLLAPPSGRTL